MAASCTTASSSCCPGPEVASVTWVPCGTSTSLRVYGHAGMVTRERTAACPTARLIWSTREWSYDSSPSLGETVEIDGTTWFVDSARAGGCMVVLTLCRPVLECPDCTVSIYRQDRGTATALDCQEALLEALVASDVEATVCVAEQRRQLVDNAEILVTNARICLDTVLEIHAGDLIYCAPTTWRIERVLSPCSASCLLTLDTIKEPFGIHVEPD